MTPARKSISTRTAARRLIALCDTALQFVGTEGVVDPLYATRRDWLCDRLFEASQSRVVGNRVVRPQGPKGTER